MRSWTGCLRGLREGRCAGCSSYTYVMLQWWLAERTISNIFFLDVVEREDNKQYSENYVALIGVMWSTMLVLVTLAISFWCHCDLVNAIIVSGWIEGEKDFNFQPSKNGPEVGVLRVDCRIIYLQRWWTAWFNIYWIVQLLDWLKRQQGLLLEAYGMTLKREIVINHIWYWRCSETTASTCTYN